ncbi:dihydrolipoyl dehydrogenase [Bifidobacterium aquikefiricola]|uniref:Dihydrolipoyl dehydrogenase n=1 Tax=Bifidobacterium aquikefiricola TaxID=3059038 RepID=A0AB39U4K6_9BIFI
MTDSSHTPGSEDTFDLVVIGSGPGGYTAALRAAELGSSVAVIEKDDVVGGVCLNRGCIPTKALITAVHDIETARHAQSVGVNLEFHGIDYGALMKHKRHMVHTMTEGLSALLSHRKVRVVHGEASIAMNHDVIVDEGDSKRTLKASDIIVATGSVARPFNDQPFSHSVIDSDRALALDTFPTSAVIIGSGAVALEFASLWNTAGTKVTLLARRDRVLSHWSRRAGVTLTRELQRNGIKVITHADTTSIDSGENLGVTVHYDLAEQRASESESGDSTESTSHQVSADVVLVAIGRTPSTGAAWFKEAGIELDNHGLVKTDELGQTSAKHIWAVGDITAGRQMAHRAFEQGMTTAEAIAGLKPEPVDNDTIPSVVFSSPEAACVGLTLEDAEAREELNDVKETAFPMLSNARVQMTGQNGSLSVVTGCEQSHPDTPIILGMHMVGPSATELIAEAEEMVGNKTPLSKAARLIHPHPTISETIGEALLKADGRPLNSR